jgi:ubiquinone/menaquinone biosynthesis C-methylase UbiE
MLADNCLSFPGVLMFGCRCCGDNKLVHHGSFRDEPERRKWQDPEAILTDAGLRPGMTFMDIGCGQGFFTVPAAKIVGKTGKVYALDISRANIEVLRTKAAEAGLTNINLKTGRAEDTLLCESCADILFFGIVLHDFEDPLKVLAKARAMVKPTGRLINLDWDKVEMNFGPPLPIRFSPEKAKQLIESSGFKVQVTKKSGLYHYVIFAVPV